MKVISFVLMITALLTNGCGNSKKTQVSSNPLYEKSFVYVDGNGNRYVISRELFEYIPTIPAQSSSGTYSGGTPVKNVPANNNFQKLADLIQSASEARSDHTEKPEMGTARIEIKDGTATNSFILRMGSSLIQQIEAVLATMK
jgi:hypothetical protein